MTQQTIQMTMLTWTATHPHHTPAETNDADSELEPFVEWIRRCTHDAEEHMKKLKLDDWITLQKQRKWRWAGRLARLESFDWTTAALDWDPTLDINLAARRRPGRPRTRWTDDTAPFAGLNVEGDVLMRHVGASRIAECHVIERNCRVKLIDLSTIRIRHQRLGVENLVDA